MSQEQLYKAYANKHHPHLKEYVSQFGNIRQSGGLEWHALPGVHPDHWYEIPFAEFAATAYPEALVIIDFINAHKRLPNFISANIPYYSYRKLYDILKDKNSSYYSK